MIANIVICLLALGVLSLVKTRRRYAYVIIAGSFLALVLLAMYFLRSWTAGIETEFLVLWDSSASGDIKLVINSISRNYGMIFPFFVIVLAALFNNLFFRYEKRKKAFSSLMIFMLCAFIMLISGENFVQIITFVFVIDILSQILIQDVQASRRYGIYNLVADMGLFLVFALMRGELDNLDMPSLIEYYNDGQYQNLIIIVMMISLFIKFGFFIFHSYLLDLQSARFHRLILIPYLSTPMVALVLFVKLKPFLIESALFCFALDIVLALTILWGAAGAVIMNNLKEKTIYFSMMVTALLVKVAANKTFEWNIAYSWLLICGFLFNLCVYYLHYYTNRDNTLAFFRKTQGVDTLPLYIVSGATMIVIAAFCACLVSFYVPQNRSWILGFGCLFLPVAANMFSRLMSTETDKPESFAFQATDYRPVPVLLMIFTVSALSAVVAHAAWKTAAAVMGIFILLVYLRPLQRWFKNDDFVNLQRADFFSNLYTFLIARPIRFTGRILTLLVDFVFFERMLVAAFMLGAGVMVRSFRQINREGGLRYVLFVMTAFAVLAVFLLRGKI